MEIGSNREFLAYLVKHLVDKPDEVQVKEVQGKHVIIYELKVAKGDMGKVIGKRGQNAGAIRLLLNAVAAKEKKRAIMEIIE